MATLKEKLGEHYQFLFQYFLRVFTILVQLGCGIWATSLTAFFNKEQVSIWAYIFFGVYLLYALWILYNLIRLFYVVSLDIRALPLPEKLPLNLDYSYIFTAVVTICVITFLEFYNESVFLWERSMHYPYAVFLPTWLGIRVFWPQTPFWLVPCGIFVPWIDLGCGFMITIWAAFYSGSRGVSEMWIGYGIFGAQCIYAVWLIYYHIKGIRSGLRSESSIREISMHPVVIAGGIGTTICFAVVASYYLFILGNENVFSIGEYLSAILLFWLEQAVLTFSAILCGKKLLVPNAPDQVNGENPNENRDGVAPVPV